MSKTAAQAIQHDLLQKILKPSLLRTGVSPEEEKQTHLRMQAIANEAKVNDVLSMLASESSESAHAESASAATRCAFDGDEGACSPDGVRRKRTHRAVYSVVSTKGKIRKRKLQHSSGLELGADSAALDLGGDQAGADLEDGIESCGGTRASGRVSYEEDEEEIPPLIRKNRRSKTRNDVLI
jgi:hypothetical protein